MESRMQKQLILHFYFYLWFSVIIGILQILAARGVFSEAWKSEALQKPFVQGTLIYSMTDFSLF